MKTQASRLLLWLPPLVFLGVFYFYPLGSIAWNAFAHPADGESTFAPLLTVFTQPRTARVIGFTFWQAFLSTILTLAVGLPGAYLLGRYEFRGKALLRALTSIPFVMPTLVVAMAFNALLGPRGWVNLGLMDIFNLSQPPLEFTNTLAAILAAHVFYNTTIVLRLVGDFWSRIDPRLAQAGRMLGASPWQTWRRVSLPLLAPAILSAALLVFIFDFTSFGVILLLGGTRFSTLEVEIYYQAAGLLNIPAAVALSMIQLICTLAMTVIYTRLSARVSRPLAQKSKAYTLRRFTTRRGRAAAALGVALLLALHLLPLSALVLRSFMITGSARGAADGFQSGWSAAAYQELFLNRRAGLFYVPPVQAVANSLGYAAATVLLSLATGMPAAWALAQQEQKDTSPPGRQAESSQAERLAARLNRAFDPLLMLPLGTSAVTLGLGFLVAFDQPPLDLRASPLLLPLAHSMAAFPFVVRTLTPALRSIRPRLRHAAALLGASPWQVVRAVDLPLTGRAVLVASVFAFTISLGEFGATALIARPEYPTIPVAIYRFFSQPGALNYGQGLALSVILMAVSAAGMLLMERFRVGETGEF